MDIPKRDKKVVKKSKSMLGGQSRVIPVASNVSFNSKEISKQFASQKTIGEAVNSAGRTDPVN